MEREYSEKNGIGKKLLQFCIGAAAGIITAALTALILSFVMTLNFIPDWMTSIAALVTQLFAAFACGFVSVRLIGSGGLLYGAISGLVLFAAQTIFSLIFSSPCLLLNFIIALLIDTAVSAIGGVIAVNTGK
ncbi:MAG: TIGR04086 family membrane protein [Clostridia bacterium]|nr:TIGR04086 family membrane protein [Clostridia bacterium]